MMKPILAAAFVAAIAAAAFSTPAQALTVQPVVPVKVRPSYVSPKRIYLTFDDGPSVYTPQVLDKLKAHGVHATFCVLGDNVSRYPDLLRRIKAEGHAICNHSKSHPNMTTVSSATMKYEITYTQNKIYSVAGVTPRYFRYPYGAYNSSTQTTLSSLGLRRLGWNIDTRDWDGPPSASTITSRVVSNAYDGAIVLMHDGGGNRSNTVASLDSTINQLVGKGYGFGVIR